MKFHVAPMLDYTDRHCRYLLRLMSKKAWLYTEMIVAQAIVFGSQERLLDFNPFEKPVVLQLGGSDPTILAQACKIASAWPYDAINLNVGCPSSRVQQGAFGACLMKQPEHVATLVHCMQQATSLPITVKCRIGVDDQDPAHILPRFIEQMQEAGIRTLIIHARKAWLAGLSPKENRDIPPLDYALVKAMKVRYPHMRIILNGGLLHPEGALSYLDQCDGVMLGRSMMKNPYLLTQVDKLYYQSMHALPSRQSVVDAYLNKYMRTQKAPLRVMLRPLLNMMGTLPGAKHWRHQLCQAETLSAVQALVDRLEDLKPPPQYAAL